MEYDFSKIKTEELRKAVDIQKENMYSCGEIKCDICPYKDTECSSMVGRINNSFKEELIRREKMENKMPELEAGMIVELNNELLMVMPSLDDYPATLFYINQKGGDVFHETSKDQISKVYEIKRPHNYRLFFENENIEIRPSLTLVWSKKSDKDIKIEELEKKIESITEEYNKSVEENREEFNRNMKELNSQIQELKG